MHITTDNRLFSNAFDTGKRMAVHAGQQLVWWYIDHFYLPRVTARNPLLLRFKTELERGAIPISPSEMKQGNSMGRAKFWLTLLRVLKRIRKKAHHNYRSMSVLG